MNYIKQTLLAIALISISVSQAQETPSNQPETIDEQFTKTIKESNSYQDFKVIKKVKMARLQSNTKKRIDGLNSEIESLKSQISTQNAEAAKVNAELEKTQQLLSTTEGEKESINFLGQPMTKSSYKTMMWSIAAILLLLLLFFIYRFRNSNVLTKEAQHKLDETEAEFDEYRRKALEKEQKLGRQLQDERNKALKSAKG